MNFLSEAGPDICASVPLDDIPVGLIETEGQGTALRAGGFTSRTVTPIRLYSFWGDHEGKLKA